MKPNINMSLAPKANISGRLSLKRPCLPQFFVFLVVEEESAAPTHHLPVGFAVGCFFVSAVVLGWWLVVAFCSSCMGCFGAGFLSVPLRMLRKVAR